MSIRPARASAYTRAVARGDVGWAAKPLFTVMNHGEPGEPFQHDVAVVVPSWGNGGFEVLDGTVATEHGAAPPEPPVPAVPPRVSPTVPPLF